MPSSWRWSCWLSRSSRFFWLRKEECGSKVSVRLGQVELQQLAGIDLVPQPVAILVADLPFADRVGLVEILDDLADQDVELDLLAEAFVGFGLVGGEVDLVGIVVDRLVLREVELLA